jgi:uncharacterized protein (DUF924 family)
LSAAGIDDILHFWFEELDPKDWWRKDDALDAKITSRFKPTYDVLREGVPASWLESPEGMLAAILVLDQFPRNMFRDDPRAFDTDAEALALAKRAIAEGMDMQLEPRQRAFIYVPFQHVEDRADQARSVELFTALGQKLNLDFAVRHKEIIDRFGRFPHRNAVLGRASTDEEAEFLKQPGSSF